MPSHGKISLAFGFFRVPKYLNNQIILALIIVQFVSVIDIDLFLVMQCLLPICVSILNSRERIILRRKHQIILSDW